MSYSKINWEDSPSTNTPINATNLNKMDTQIKQNETNITTNTSNITALDTRLTTVETDIATLENALENANEYSTTETVVGKWIDGRPVYRKVVDIGNLPNSTYKNVAHNISNINEFTFMYAIITAGSNWYVMPMVGTSEMYASATMTIRANITAITVATTSDRSSDRGYAVLEYTKTTDSAS